MVNCCVPYCSSSSYRKDKDTSFHEFPSDSDLCAKWLKNISRKDFVINDKSCSTVVCNKHFNEEDYVPGLKRRRLVKNAVPSIFDKYPAYLIPKKSKTRRKLIRKRPVSKENICDTEETSPKVKRLKVDIYENPLCITNSTTENSYIQVPNSVSFINNSAIAECNGNQLSKVTYFRSALKKKQREIRLLKSTVWKKNDLIQLMRNKINNLQKKVDYYEKSKQHSSLEKLIIFQEETGSKSANFIVQQVDNFFVKRPTWNEGVIRECVLLNSCCPNGYRLMQRTKLLKLPSRVTLNRYMGPFTGELGITPLIKERLKEEASNLNDFEKFCSLIVDEMAIKPSLIYDAKVDSYFGFQTNTENKSSRLLVNRLLCFMINGLFSKHCIPCGYFFPKQLTGKELHDLTLNVIKEVEESSFRLMRVVTDNHKTNVAILRMLGNGKLEYKVEHPVNNSRFLFLSFDPNHIIKNLRSQFLEKEMADGEKIISGSYVKQLYSLQQKDIIKAVRNLSKRHVEPSNIDKNECWPCCFGFFSSSYSSDKISM